MARAKREYLGHLEIEECHAYIDDKKHSWDGGGNIPRHLQCLVSPKDGKGGLGGHGHSSATMFSFYSKLLETR